MTPATVTVDLPTADELVTCALERLDWAFKGLDKPLTPARLHAIRNHIAVAKAALLTPPLRPNDEVP